MREIPYPQIGVLRPTYCSAPPKTVMSRGKGASRQGRARASSNDGTAKRRPRTRSRASSRAAHVSSVAPVGASAGKKRFAPMPKMPRGKRVRKEVPLDDAVPSNGASGCDVIEALTEPAQTLLSLSCRDEPIPAVGDVVSSGCPTEVGSPNQGSPSQRTDESFATARGSTGSPCERVEKSPSVERVISDEDRAPFISQDSVRANSDVRQCGLNEAGSALVQYMSSTVGRNGRSVW